MQYDTGKQNLDKQIEDNDKEIIDTRGQLSNFNTNITEIENKIPRTSGLVSKPVLTQRLQKLEIKKLDTNCLIKKTDQKTKITRIESKMLDVSDLITKTFRC